MATENYANNISTTINQGGGISSGATSVTVTSAIGFPAVQFRILIDSEIMIVTNVSSNTFTITRGAEGTTAASHANGATVTHVLTRDGLKGVSGSINLTDTFANLPAAATDGRLFVPSNGIQLLRDSSLAWAPWGPIFPMTQPPSLTGPGSTTLSGNGGSITSGATSFNVASSASFPATPFLVQIGSEDIKVTTVSGTNWTVTRGYNGTTAASHNDGDTVSQLNWEWVNQGGASVVTTQGGVFLHVPGNNSNNARIYKTVAPNTPYTITAYVDAFSTANNYHQWGLLFRESSSGKLHTFDNYYDDDTSARGIRISEWTSATGESTSFSFFKTVRSYQWLQISDDGTNRIYRVSADGQNFLQWYTEGRTTFLTADEVGFYGNCQNASSADMGVTLFSWKQS